MFADERNLILIPFCVVVSVAFFLIISFVLYIQLNSSLVQALLKYFRISYFDLQRENSI